MKATVKAALITGILGIVGTVSAAFIGIDEGKAIERANIQNQFNAIIGDGANVVGNEITVNDIEGVMNNYLDLQEQKESLLAQNAKYFEDLTIANKTIDELESNNIPEFCFSDLALSIDADEITINKNNAMVSIDGREYLSKEIVEKLVSSNQSMIIKDNTLFIGKVIADRASLFDQNILNRSDHLSYNFTGKDSYGNMRSNSISNGYYGSSIIFTLGKKYAYLKCTISMSEDYSVGSSTTLKIMADENVVYTCEIDKKTEPYDIEIPINNCELLTIDFDSGSGKRGCIVSEAIIYN